MDLDDPEFKEIPREQGIVPLPAVYRDWLKPQVTEVLVKYSTTKS